MELSPDDLNPPAALVYSHLTDQTDARTPLLAAAENGATDIVKMLLQKGVPPDICALPLAATQGHAATCSVLLESMQAQIDPEARKACIGRALVQVNEVGAVVESNLSMTALELR